MNKILERSDGEFKIAMFQMLKELMKKITYEEKEYFNKVMGII